MVRDMLLEEILCEVSRELGLSQDDVFTEGVTFRDVLGRSPVAINSIDIVEAIAVALTTHDLQDTIDIPALTLEDLTLDLRDHLAAHLTVAA